MQNSQALKIIRDLANGLDPTTQRELPPGTPFEQPAVIRALFAAARALEAAPQNTPQTHSEPQNLAPQVAPVPTAPAASTCTASTSATSAPAVGWEIRPANSGKPWSRDEDARLCQGFERGVSQETLAQIHARSIASIQSRLVKLGKLAPEQAASPTASAST